MNNDQYHSGEKAIQKITKEADFANANSRLISNIIVRSTSNFIEQQAMAIVCSASAREKIWVSLLIGKVGFVKVPEPELISFDKDLLQSTKQDIFYENILTDPEIGSLFIELTSRKRYRVNGKVDLYNDIITLHIKTAYPNCPKYIQRRIMSLPGDVKTVNAEVIKGSGLRKEFYKIITEADTLFVGSKAADGTMDASHRGGNPGFIEILDNNIIKIPEYKGNSMFNTLGNFVQNPHAGLLFIDFLKRETLQMTGSVEMKFNQTGDDFIKTNGTGRHWLFKTDEWIYTTNHHAVNWEFFDYSPYNP